MKILKVLVVLLVTVAISAAAFVWLGIYNIAADDPHWDSTYRVLETVRDRSIRSRAGAVVVPALDDAALIRSGAGNYSSMCVDCHLSPGAAETELSLGLYPTPPAWSALAKTDPRDAFWVIKHGIKMSGMPAWGKSMDDQYIWGMVAFISHFPGMSAERYRELVASSGGHSHGGGETMMDQDGSMRGSEHNDGHGHDEGARSSFEPVDDPMAGAKPNPKPEGDHEHQR